MALSTVKTVAIHKNHVLLAVDYVSIISIEAEIASQERKGERETDLLHAKIAPKTSVMQLC